MMSPEIMQWVYFLLIGLVAGFFAGQLLKGRGFGVLGNMIVGVLGALLGGFLFSLLGVSAGGGLIGSIVTATVGAVVLLVLASFLQRNVPAT